MFMFTSCPKTFHKALNIVVVVNMKTWIYPSGPVWTTVYFWVQHHAWHIRDAQWIFAGYSAWAISKSCSWLTKALKSCCLVYLPNKPRKVERARRHLFLMSKHLVMPWESLGPRIPTLVPLSFSRAGTQTAGSPRMAFALEDSRNLDFSSEQLRRSLPALDGLH